jgi:succinate-semialdehyde dehydrogenase
MNLAGFAMSITKLSADDATDLLSGLQRIDLVRNRLFIGGQWAPGRGEALDVRNPADGRAIIAISKASADDARAAIAAAKAAFPSWRRTLAKERGDALSRWAGLMTAHREDLARIMTYEQGKPLAEARGEIDYAASFLIWFAAEAERLNGDVIPPHLPERRLLCIREPIGVAAAITPWNFPSAMITRKAGAALAAGCVMVVRPASETPLSALALAVLAQEAGIPPGVFNVVVGDGAEIARVLTESPDVRALSFTGSTEIGRILLRQCADTVKKTAMELGGHAPFIVFDDAPLDKAVNDAMTAKFQTSGQDCLAANRILVHRRVYDAFCAHFSEAVQGLKVGFGWEEGVDIGPLIDQATVAKCASQVEDALSRGARLLAGGGRSALGNHFFEPTVLADVVPGMAIFSEETFGPVAALLPFDTEEEAIALANDSEYGLAAYLYTENMRRIWRLSESLDYGMIGVNTPKFTGPPIPFGGCKQSGLGREGGRLGVDEFMETKYLCMEIA